MTQPIAERLRGHAKAMEAARTDSHPPLASKALGVALSLWAKSDDEAATALDELEFLVRNQDRYNDITARMDASHSDEIYSVASFEKEFVAKYDRRKRAALSGGGRDG